MVIRAKDQASRVITGMSRNMSADFRRLQTAATLTAQKSAIDMARVRQTYADQILTQQNVLNGAMAQNNKARAQGARAAIRDLRAMQQAEVIGIRQEQIMQREIMHTARRHAEAKAAAIEGKRAAASAAGQWIAVGAGMAIVGAAGVKALHSMAMASVEYQRQATLTQTQLGKQQASVQELQTISTNVARTVGVPIMELQGALYDIFSSTDIKVKDSQGVLEKFAKAAVAGQVSVASASSATISVMNGYQKSASDLTRILDVQFAAVRLGRMTYDQFAGAIGKAIPSAVAANQSFETLAGSMAFLTRAGLTAAQSAISFARLSDMFRRANVPTELRKIGIEAYNSQGRLRPINVLLSEMAEKFKPLSASARQKLFEQIFSGKGTIQAQRFFNLAIEGADQLNQYIKEVEKSTGDFQAAYDKMAGSVAVKTIVLQNNWQIFKMQLGEAAIPVLNALIEVGIKVLGWLNDLSPAQKRVIATTIGLVSVVVGLSGVLLAIGSTIKMVIAGFGILQLATSGLSGAFTAARFSALGLIGTLGLLAAAILLAANAKKIDQKADEIGLSIHQKYVRPFYERIGLIRQSTGAVSEHGTAMLRSSGRTVAWVQTNKAATGSTEDLNLAMNDARGAMASSSAASIAAAKAAGGYGASIKAAGESNQKAAAPMQRVIELTKEQREQFQKLAEQTIASGLSGMAARQDKVAEATQRLRDAQADLSEAQRGGGGAATGLSAAQERVHDASVRVEKAQIGLRDKTKDSRLEHIRLREAQHDLTRAQAAARGSNTKTAGSLNTVRDASQRVKEAQKALKDAVGETAEETLRRFREEAAAARNWSKNMRTLLARGVDPAVVAELAQQGPAHIAKFVGKGKAFYAELNRAFKEKSANSRVASRILNLAMTGDIEKFKKNGVLDVAALSRAVGLSMSKARGAVADNTGRSQRTWRAAWGDMSRSTKNAMTRAGEDMSRFRAKANRELDNIRDEPVKLTITDRMSSALQKRLSGAAQGMRITKGTTATADDVLIRVSKGETVVPTRSSNKPEFKSWAASEGIPGFASGGAIDPMRVATFDPRVLRTAGQNYAKHLSNKLSAILGKKLFDSVLKGNFGPGRAGVKNFIRSMDPLPYIWGGAGPGGYDCSGAVGAVHLAHMKRPFGHGQRLYTTSSIRTGISGLKAGLGGVLDIGVTAGTGHMAGRYGGLRFEARSSRSGILVGAAARPPESFSRKFHLASGGRINDQMVDLFKLLGRYDIGGDRDRMRIGNSVIANPLAYHRGGRIQEDIMGVGSSGRAYSFQAGETVVAKGDPSIVVNINGPVFGADADQLAEKIHQALLRKKRRTGGVVLGLT